MKSRKYVSHQVTYEVLVLRERINRRRKDEEKTKKTRLKIAIDRSSKRRWGLIKSLLVFSVCVVCGRIGTGGGIKRGVDLAVVNGKQVNGK